MLKIKALNIPEGKQIFWNWDRCNHGPFSWFYKPYKEIRYFFRRVKKNYLIWKNVLRYDYDFEFHCHFTALRYKLECVENCLKSDYAEQENQHMKALRICIKLAKKIEEDKYDERVWDFIEKKYGALGNRSVELPDKPGYFQWISNYGGDESEETKQKAFEDRKVLHAISEKRQHRDERNLYAIMLKYRQNWWS